MATSMALKRKAGDGLEEQPRPKTQAIPCEASQDLVSSVKALVQQSQHANRGINTQHSDGRASADVQRNIISSSEVERKRSHNGSSADKTVTSKTGPVVHGMITRRLTKFMTFAAVLNTGELLEQIIYNLPAETIVRLRRVSKTWNRVILTHRLIRRKIFLEPEPLGGFWVYDTVKRCLHPYVDDMSKAYGIEWANRQSYSRPVQLNTMLFKRDDRAESVSIFQRATVCESLRLIARPSLQRRARIHHHMYITQPPVTIVEFTIYYHDRARKRAGLPSPTRSTRLKVIRHAGVRFGDIINEFVKKAMALHSLSVAQNPTLPHPDFFIRTIGHTVKKTVIWTLGGIYVTEEEKAAVEKLGQTMSLEIASPVPTPPLSPQALELMKANNGRKIDFGSFLSHGISGGSG